MVVKLMVVVVVVSVFMGADLVVGGCTSTTWAIHASFSICAGTGAIGLGL